MENKENPERVTNNGDWELEDDVVQFGIEEIDLLDRSSCVKMIQNELLNIQLNF